MNKIQEKISYIEGLAEGINFYQNSKEGKIFSEMIHVLSELSENLDHTTKRLTELEDYVEAIDEDLNDIEWDFYDDEEDEDLEETEGLNDEESEQFVKLECPVCHEVLMVEDHLLNDEGDTEIICPNCDELIIIDQDNFYHMENQQH